MRESHALNEDEHILGRLAMVDQCVLAIWYYDEGTKDDPVETLIEILGEHDIVPVGDFFEALKGKRKAMFQSYMTDLVYVFDIHDVCERLLQGERVSVKGEKPSKAQLAEIEAFSEEEIM